MFDRTAMRLRLSEQQNHRCCYCGLRMTAPGERCPREVTIDHVVPKCEGGTADWENVVAACWLCNMQRGNSSATAFYEQRMVTDAQATPPSYRPGMPKREHVQRLPQLPSPQTRKHKLVLEWIRWLALDDAGMPLDEIRAALRGVAVFGNAPWVSAPANRSSHAG